MYFPSLWRSPTPVIYSSPPFFGHWYISPDDIEWLWVIKDNCINSGKIAPSRHILINVWWKLEIAGIYLNRWKPGALQHLSALPFNIFFKVRFPGLYDTTKVQKNVIVWHDLPIFLVFFIYIKLFKVMSYHDLESINRHLNESIASYNIYHLKLLKF